MTSSQTHSFVVPSKEIFISSLDFSNQSNLTIHLTHQLCPNSLNTVCDQDTPFHPIGDASNHVNFAQIHPILTQTKSTQTNDINSTTQSTLLTDTNDINNTNQPHRTHKPNQRTQTANSNPINKTHKRYQKTHKSCQDVVSPRWNRAVS